MNDQITIKELCKRLNSNEEEKWAFLNGLSNPQFLEPFYKYDVLRFDDSCFNVTVNYLISVFDDNYKLIAKIINHNIINTTMPSNRGFIFKDLLEKFSLSQIEKYLEYEKLFEFKDSVYICESFLDRSDLQNFPKIYLACIKNLIKYEIKEEKYAVSHKVPQLFHRQYLFQKIFLAQNQLKTILAKKNCYTLLKTEYQKLFDEFGDLSVYSKQYIDPDKIEIDDYKTKDVRDIILTFMAIYLKVNNHKKEVERLLNSNIPMFVKLGLYSVGRNISYYQELFNRFLLNNSDVDKLYQYKYEILTIFEEIQNFYNSTTTHNSYSKSPYNKLEATISSFFERIPASKIKEKYLFLHGLKTHPKFSKLFNEIKKDFGNREIYNPKLFISAVEIYSVQNVSFITKQGLNKKNIEKQVEYWNTASKRPSKRIKREHGIVYEENLEGLLHVTREIINENIKEYLKQIKVLQKLHDAKVISVFFEVLNKKIEEKVIKKTSFNKIIKLTEHYLQNYKMYKSYGFDYDLSNLLRSIIINSGEDSIELHQKISIILRNLILQNSKEKNRGEDYSFYSINTSSGRYWECFIILIDYKKTMAAEEKYFLEKALFKEKYLYSEKLMLFHLGTHANSMIFRLKKYPWEQNIYKALHDNIHGCEPFLQGFLSYVTYIEAFKSFQELVLKNYQKINLPSDIYRRFLGLLCDIKFRNTFNEESLIEKFESSFKNKEYNKILTILAMPENVKKFDKIRVLEFWEKIILKNLDFDSSFAIVDQYMEPHELLDYYQNLYELMRKKHSSNSEQMPFYFEKFLNKILLVLKQTNEREELTKIYNLLCKAIENTVGFNYKGEIPEILKSLLQEYNKKTTDNAQNNVQNLAIKICQTPGLIQYANLYTNFI